MNDDRRYLDQFTVSITVHLTTVLVLIDFLQADDHLIYA